MNWYKLSLKARTDFGLRVAVSQCLTAWNNNIVASTDPILSNPIDTDGLAWVKNISLLFPSIRDEWVRFVQRGNRLPFIDDLVNESQGNEGAWRAGLLIHRGRPAEPLATEFPLTIAALAGIPGLRSALFSVMGAGAELPEHVGPNAGVLRYHLGIDCAPGSALKIGDATIQYGNGESILFDDTDPHAGWNRGPSDRVTLFCEIDRPLEGFAALFNLAVQFYLARDRRYRRAPIRAAEWNSALNH